MERHPSLDERFDPAIRIVEYDPAWPARAAAELALIADAVGPLAVRLEHVGSTAVPGLAAKPIVDLQLSVSELEPLAAYVEPLERLGYLFVGDPESPDYHFLAKPPERPRSFHLHVCAAGSDHELRHLAVRDYLRAHDDEAAAYAAVKRRVASEHPEDRLAYIEGKDAHLQALESRAVAWNHGAMDAHPVELDYDWHEQFAIGQAFRVGDVIHTSGQAAVARDGSLVGVGDFAAQAEQTMANLAAVLEAGGSGLDRVFKVTIYLTDMAHFPEIVELRRRHFSPPWPADTIVQVAALALPELMIEIEAQATVGR